MTNAIRKKSRIAMIQNVVILIVTGIAGFNCMLHHKDMCILQLNKRACFTKETGKIPQNNFKLQGIKLLLSLSNKDKIC